MSVHLSRTSLVVAVALAVTLATPVETRADTSPSITARMLYERFANGDSDGYKRMWLAGAAPTYLREFDLEGRVRCSSLAAFDAAEPQIDGDHAVVRARATLLRRSIRTGRTAIEVEWPVIGMQRVNGEWRVDRWVLQEDDLVDKIAAAKSDDEARQIVRENFELLGATFFRFVRRKSPAMINGRKYDAYQRVIAALHEYASLELDDSAQATAYVLDSIYDRVGPKPDVAKSMADVATSLALAEKSGDSDAIASALLNTVRAYQWRDGNTTNGAPLLARVVAMRDRLDDDGLAARAAILMANLHIEHGDYRAAFPYLEIAQAIAKHSNDPSVVYQTYLLLSDLYADQHDFELAIPNMIRAREWAEKAHFDGGVAGSLQTLAHAYLSIGRRAEFRAAANEALARATGTLVSEAEQVLVDVAVDGLQHHDIAGADKAMATAIEKLPAIKEDTIRGDVMETLARVRLTQHRYDEAIHAAQEAISWREKQETVARSAPWFIEAQAYLARGDRAATYRALHAAVDYGELERAGLAGSERQFELYFEPAVAAYVMLVDLLIEDHRFDEAFLVAEKSKARTLLDVMATERSSTAVDIPAADVAEERRLEANLAEANRKKANVEKSRLELETYRGILDARYPRLRNTRGPETLSSVKSLAPLLSANRALVEYVVSAKAVHLFIARRGVPLQVRTARIGRNALETLVREYARQLAARDALYRPNARRLYDLLLKPVIEAAGPAKMLTIIPDDELWRVPFETLVDANGKFAVETRAFHYAPSSAVLLADISRHVTPPREHAFLAFANPRQKDLPMIPEAEREARSIARLFGERRSAVFAGAEALESRSKVEAPRYRVVHFATHGVLDNANPMYSHIVLARREGDGEDGALEAREIMKLRLAADLVVLSACDTARGDVRAGEGLIGMTWAIFASGCPSVIASEWRAGSTTTEILMTKFYTSWLRNRAAAGPYAKATALRDAELSVLRDPRYRHPYYWSPFVLVGRAE